MPRRTSKPAIRSQYAVQLRQADKDRRRKRLSAAKQHRNLNRTAN